MVNISGAVLQNYCIVFFKHRVDVNAKTWSENNDIQQYYIPHFPKSLQQFLSINCGSCLSAWSHVVNIGHSLVCVSWYVYVNVVVNEDVIMSWLYVCYPSCSMLICHRCVTVATLMVSVLWFSTQWSQCSSLHLRITCWSCGICRKLFQRRSKTDIAINVCH